MKHLVKIGNKIKGFVYQDCIGEYWYAFGKPSQREYIAFKCTCLEQGIARIETATESCTFGIVTVNP